MSTHNSSFDKIWRYMMCSMAYKPTTIVIGQCPYDDPVIPILGSAFSQSDHTKDAPATDIFSRHFENGDEAIRFIRSNWKLLSCKIPYVH
jgi:hypothetical protein